MFIEILFKMLLFKGGVLIYAEHCNMASCSELCSVNKTATDQRGSVLDVRGPELF